MAKQRWSRPLRPGSLPVVGSFTAATLILGSAILLYRRRHGRGVEIKMTETEVVGSVIHSLNSPHISHLLLLMSQDYPATMANMFSGNPEIDDAELERGNERFWAEHARIKTHKQPTPRWHLHHHISHWLHRHG